MESFGTLNFNRDVLNAMGEYVSYFHSGKVDYKDELNVMQRFLDMKGFFSYISTIGYPYHVLRKVLHVNGIKKEIKGLRFNEGDGLIVETVDDLTYRLGDWDVESYLVFKEEDILGFERTIIEDELYVDLYFKLV